MKTVYTIVLKGFWRAEHREIVEIKGLRMESLKALEEILWDHCLCWRKLLQFVRIWNSSVLYLARELYWGQALCSETGRFYRFSEFEKERRKACKRNSAIGRVPVSSERKLRDREQCSWEGQGERSWNSTQERVPIAWRPQGCGKLQDFLEGVCPPW